VHAWARVSILTGRSGRGRYSGPKPVTDWGQGPRAVTPRAHRPRVRTSRRSGRHHDTDIAIPCTLRLSRAISSANCTPSVTGICAGFGLLDDNGDAFRHDRFLFLRGNTGLCVGQSLAGTSPKCCSAHANTSPLIGLIWPKPAAPRSPEPQRGGETSSLAKAIPRETRKSPRRILRCASAQTVRRRSPSAFRSPSRPRWSRSSKTARRRTWLTSAHSRNPPGIPGRNRHPEPPDQGVRIVPEADRATTTRRATGSTWSCRDRSRLVEALQRGPRLSLGQAGRSELQRPDLRQPLRRRRRRDLHPDLVRSRKPNGD